MHQTINIWSLGCEFSIAATWVALGYQGILQYTELRKKAVKDYQSETPPDATDSSESQSSNDYFRDGHTNLSVVKSWHASLRMILRKTDTITSLVLDLVDDHMLLAEPLKRLPAKDLCIKLGEILEKGKTGQAELGKEIPQLIIDALGKLDDSVPARPPPKTPSEEASSDSHSRNAKSTRLEVPLMKTTHRSVAYKPEQLPTSPPLGSLAPMGEHEVLEEDAAEFHLPLRTAARDTPFLPINQRSIDELSQYTSSASQSIFSTPPLKVPVASASSNSIPSIRAPAQTAFQAKQELDKQSKKDSKIFSKVKKALGRPTKDKVLSDHFVNRDLVSFALRIWK